MEPGYPLIGSLIVGLLITLLVGVNVWVTGWASKRPNSPNVKQWRTEERSGVVDVTFFVMLLLASAALVKETLPLIDKNGRVLPSSLTYGASLVLLLAFTLALLPRVSRWLRVLVPLSVAGVVLVASQCGSVFVGQLLLVAGQISLLGAAASWPYWLGSRQSGLPAYGMFAVPRLTFMLACAALADVFYRWNDLSVFTILNQNGFFVEVTYPAEAGTGVLDETLYAEQGLSYGLLTPLVLMVVISGMTMWSRYMNKQQLITWPLLGFLLGMIVANVVAVIGGDKTLAAPYIAAGVISGMLLATVKSRMWPLLGWHQGWHVDQTHRMLPFSMQGDEFSTGRTRRT